MVAPSRAISELHLLLRTMPPGEIDMDRIAEAEHRRGRRFFDDPPEVVWRWLLEQPRRLARRSGSA